jgi:formylglycine-generating enzyme required for sulfatase activity
MRKRVTRLLLLFIGIAISTYCLEARYGEHVEAAGIGVCAATAQKRAALVIGNSSYMVGPLANPVADAEAVAKALRDLCFDRVILKKDLNTDGMRAALKEFGGEVVGAEIGVVFFAGHGTEIAGRNYLIPVDARLARAADVDLEAIGLDTVLGQLAGVSKLKLVILDACRNNLFPLAGAKRAVTRGLARVDPEDNTLIAYAAKEGTTADDGVGRKHSPFTEALLKHIATPGIEVDYLFRLVRDDVLDATDRQQVPNHYNGLGRERIFLVPPLYTSNATEGPAAHAAPPTKSPVPAMPTAPPNQSLGPAANSQAAATDDFAKRFFWDKFFSNNDLPAAMIEPPLSCGGVETQIGNERRCLKPKDSFKDCPTCPEMVVVPAGKFMMGSPESEPEREYWQKGAESPLHEATIPQSFAVGRFAVTRGEYEVFMKASGHKVGKSCWIVAHGEGNDVKGKSFRDPGFMQDGKHPVVCVNWYDAKAYVAWLSKTTGKSYRLLSEAEREYATRAGTTTPFWWGTSISTSQANYNGNSTYGGGVKGERRKKTVPVDSFQPNPWGLYQMHGNVSEWTEDCWSNDYKDALTDGSARTTDPLSGDCFRVLRGGDWYADARDLRAASRQWYNPDNWSQFTGFRVARSLSP